MCLQSRSANAVTKIRYESFTGTLKTPAPLSRQGRVGAFGPKLPQKITADAERQSPSKMNVVSQNKTNVSQNKTNVSQSKMNVSRNRMSASPSKINVVSSCCPFICNLNPVSSIVSNEF